LSNVRNSSNTGKFTFIPLTDDNGRNSGINDPAKPKHSKRRKTYQANAPKIADEAENKSKLNFADDEMDAVADGSGADSDLEADGDSPNPADQDLSPQDDIPPHQPRSPTDSDGTTAISSTSLRSKQVRHKRKNPVKATNPNEVKGSKQGQKAQKEQKGQRPFASPAWGRAKRRPRYRR